MKVNINLIRLSYPIFIYYLLNYLIVIFLKNKIGFSEYGQIGIILSYSALFQTFIMFGYNNGVDLVIFNNKSWIDYIENIIKVTILFSVVTLSILYFISELNLIILIGLIHSIFFLIVGVYKAKLTALNDYKKNSLIQLLNVGFSSLLTFFIYIYVQDYKWRIIFLIISDISIVLLFFRTDFLQFFNKFSLKKIFILNYFTDINFYLFIVLHGLFSFFYTNYDRIYIAKKTTLSISGQYWYYLQLTLPILVIGEILVRYKIKELYSNSFYLKIKAIKFQINIYSLLFFLMFSLFFFTSTTAIIILIGGQIMNAMYLPLSSIMFSKKKSNYILIFTIFISLVQFFIYFLFNLNNLILFSKTFCFLSILRTLIYWIFIVNFINNEEQDKLQNI
jgi:hypothetical protein